MTSQYIFKKDGKLLTKKHVRDKIIKKRKKILRMKIIAKIYTDFDEKFGIPRQSGICDDLVGKIVFEPEYRNPDALRGLDEYSHLWILWNFSKAERNEWSPTVRPPRLGGNKRMGVFATRSPFRPNPIGLSSVKLERIEHTQDMGDVIIVKGADILSGTPIYDIKPYLAYTDSHPDARGGFSDGVRDYTVKVEIDDDLLQLIPEDKRQGLIRLLEDDPRPSYVEDEERIYGMAFAGLEVKFKVANDVLRVTEIYKRES